jgi:L-galactose dehydrogenase
MKYRPLGSTGLEVSALGFGASPLGDVYGRVSAHDSVRAVHCAIDNGINFFDVSPYYGLTLAESRLGEALEGKRDRVILATKCGRYDDREFDFSAARVAASVEESLKRLRTDYLDVIQAHDIEFADYRQLIGETLPELRRLQTAGKVRWVGISAFPCDVLCQVASAVKVDTILSYCRYNLLINDMDERLTPLARCKKIGLINASPLLMGILTEAGPPPWHPAPARTKRVGARIVELCRLHGVRAADVALRFCLDHDYVSTTLVGMSTTRQVEDNIRASAFEIAPELMEQIRKMVEPVGDFTWPSGGEVRTQ